MKTKFNWTDVTKEDVDKAIENFLTYKPSFPPARNTFLLYDGMKLPAKHIRGMAYREHYGEEIGKDDYTGGEETVQFFIRLGFDVEYKKEIIKHTDKSTNKKSSKETEKDKIVEKTVKKEDSETVEKAESIKIAMYLQTDELKNNRAFKKIVPVMKKSDADIIVFPEDCFIPEVEKLHQSDITSEEGLEVIYNICLDLSEELGKAVIVSSKDAYGSIFSVFANANALENETEIELYIKHTMCNSSCLEFNNYSEIASVLFNPIVYKGYLIGMTICYDCTHALFSRLYGIYGIDLIVNSTGGNVKRDKWFKYNKVRAIENDCYTLVTMGEDGSQDNNYVFGFNKNGGQLRPVNLCGDSSEHNIPGGLYVYEVSKESGQPEPDESNKMETENKNWDLKYPVGEFDSFIEGCDRVTDKIYHKKVKGQNVFFLVVDGEDILKPEIVQKLLYAKEIKKYSNRRYVIINRFKKVDESFYKDKLSVLLKVRATENYCAVILLSDNINKCYQSGQTKNAQVVKPTGDYWRIDLKRTTGPEAIWKNKVGMRESWRENYEWLVENAEKLYEEE